MYTLPDESIAIPFGVTPVDPPNCTVGATLSGADDAPFLAALIALKYTLGVVPFTKFVVSTIATGDVVRAGLQDVQVLPSYEYW